MLGLACASRFLRSSSSRCRFYCSSLPSSSSDSKSMPTTRVQPLKLGDWTPPLVADPIPRDTWTVDLGRWIFTMGPLPSGLRASSEKQFYINVVKAVGRILNDDEHAKNIIYHTSLPDRGFCAFIDKQTKDKLRAVEGVIFVIPDVYYEARIKDCATHQNFDDQSLVNNEEMMKT